MCGTEQHSQTRRDTGGRWNQNFKAWGLSLFPREKRALRYFLRRGSLEALMFDKMAASTAFWALNLSAETSFFYQKRSDTEILGAKRNFSE